MEKEQVEIQTNVPGLKSKVEKWLEAKVFPMHRDLNTT